jgi:hypothetical protein
MIKHHDPPLTLTPAQREWTTTGDCPSISPTDWIMDLPYLCTLDTGHPDPHIAGTDDDHYCATWTDRRRRRRRGRSR